MRKLTLLNTPPPYGKNILKGFTMANLVYTNDMIAF